jgi:hypothetical protein
MTNFITTEAGYQIPQIESGDRVPVTVVPPQSWARQHARLLIAAVAALVVGAGVTVALLLTVFHGGGSQISPAAVLSHDGYTAIIPSMTPKQIGQFEMLGGGSSSDQGTINAMVTGGAIGIKGGDTGSMEIVLSLTSAGQAMVAPEIGNPASMGLPQGVTAHLDGGNVVISGPSSAFGGNGTTAS